MRNILPSKFTICLQEFSKLCGDKGQLLLLLDRINSPFVRSNNSVLQELMRLIPFMAFGDEEKMTALINHFKPYLDFAKYVCVFEWSESNFCGEKKKINI